MDLDLQARLAAAIAPAYDIEGELGRGGMAIVYRGRDARLKRPVAIKLLPPELAFRGDIRTRFLREAETAARLSHPNIVPIYAVDERESMVYIVMALVQGESVGDRVRRSGPLPIDDARRILREVAEALAYAHSHGVIHRDIKPDNVLLDSVSGRAMVTDFGIARAASSEGDGARLTATGAVIGTPSYMSPEQCAGDREIDGRSDLYSLGTVAYQMLVGEPPFVGGNAPSLMMRQVTEAPTPVRQRRYDVPDDLDRIVMRLLAKNPDERFEDGAALLAALDGAHVTPVATATSRLRASARPPLVASPRRPLDPLIPPHVKERIERSMSRAEERALRRREKRGENRPLVEQVRRFRGRVLGYAGTSAFLFGINAVTMGPSNHFWWFIFPVMGMGMGIIGGMSRLLGEGVPLKSLMNGTLPPELANQADRDGVHPAGHGDLGLAHRGIRGLVRLLESASAPAAVAAAAPQALPVDTNDEVRKGPYGPVLSQAMLDRNTVADLFGRLSDAERKMLPDVRETANALFARVVSLASALQRLEGQVDSGRATALDERIARIEQQTGEASERERQLNLLRRQRESLAELTQSKRKLLEQYETAGVLLQNLALDLLKVRSSGLDSALNGLTSATQEARALSREIGYVLNAADELRDIGRA